MEYVCDRIHQLPDDLYRLYRKLERPLGWEEALAQCEAIKMTRDADAMLRSSEAFMMSSHFSIKVPWLRPRRDPVEPWYDHDLANPCY